MNIFGKKETTIGATRKGFRVHKWIQALSFNCEYVKNVVTGEKKLVLPLYDFDFDCMPIPLVNKYIIFMSM